ncbi:Alpha/Beta hydrolase protein [Mycena olivaceomarginata]|nr:Alpha/Beta hydrolase protein [Mycena olivaceomarginata]
MAEYAHLSTPDPEFSVLWSKLQAAYPPPGTITVASQRHAMTSIVNPKVMDNLRPHLPPGSAYRVTEDQVPVDGGKIAVRCIEPVPQDDETAGFPLLVWFHGGGWISGDLDLDDFYLRILSVELRLSIVNVDYRLAPEHQFLSGLNDCYSALKWAMNNAPKLSASVSRGFLVGGASAGGHLAAAVIHRARDDPSFDGRRPTGHILQSPSLIHPQAYPEQYKTQLLSLEQNQDAPMIGRASLNFFLECLQVDASHPEISPLLLSHEKLPPAYIQVAGLDPLRDEALLYTRLLRECGVLTNFDVYPGVPHGFHLNFPQLAASIKWETDIRAGIRWLLKEGSSLNSTEL